MARAGQMMNKVDRLIAAILSVALSASSLLVVVEVLLAAFDRETLLIPSEKWSESLRSTTWDQPSFRFIVMAMMVGAIGFLWFEFRPRGRATWQLAGASPALIGRSDLERLLTRSVAGVGQVERAHLRLGARKLRIRVETAGSKASVGAAKTQVRSAVSDTATRLGIVKLPKVKIKAYPRGELV